jgi:hypothetical protein
MRINPKSFTLALVLTTTLAATSSALAASRPAAQPQSREIDGAREPNVIVRVIDAIKKRVHSLGDGIIVPPVVP